jgi:lipoyl-dependent peroxiredoxin subunit D
MFGTANTTNNATALLQDLGIPELHSTPALKLLGDTDARYLRDLKINVSNVLNAETLGAKDASLLAYAVAVNEKNTVLQEAFCQMATKHGATEKELAEVISCTSLLSANNVYYRFRHFMEDEFYSNAAAGIRMSIMANPSLGKELFELISLAVSAVNGCELCVTSHEKTLVAHGSDKTRIHDAIRLAAVIRSLSILI